MKSLILIICLFIAGCENDYELINTCTKTKQSNSLLIEEVYEIEFKENQILNINYTIMYLDENKETIDSLKQSLGNDVNYLIENRQIVTENEKQIKYLYSINESSSEEIKEHFSYSKTRIDLKRTLESEGYSCE